MNSFLKYSLQHEKRIKLVIQLEDRIVQVNGTVTAIGEDCFSYVASGRKKVETAPMDTLLAAGYARGDAGEE